MAVDIRQYARQVGAPQGRLAQAGDIAAPTDGGMAQALGELAQTAQQVYDRSQARKDELDLLDYERKLSEIDTQNMLGDDETPGAMRTMGVNASGVTDTTLKAFDTQTAAIQPKLRTQAAQAKAQQMLSVRREDMHKRLARHEFDQGRVADNQMTEAALTQYGNEALQNADDPTMVKASLARANGVIEANGRRMGEPPELTAQKQVAFTSTTLRDVISSQITRDPIRALDTYKESSDLLVGDDRLRVEAALQPYITDVQSRSLGDSIWAGGDSAVATGSGAVYDAIAQVESGNRHFDDAGNVIRGPAVAGSGARAVGKFQIMPSTGPEAARLAGVKWDPVAFEKDENYNAKLGRAYLDAQIRRFGGDMALVSAAYNMGPEATEKWARGEAYQTQSGKWWNPKGPRDPAAMPTETRNYIAKVTARMGGKEPVPGMRAPGNINLHDRPVVKNDDGSISTVRTISVGMDGGEYLIPTVSEDGRIMSDEEAIRTFEATGRHLGVFDSPKAATAYAEKLHENQAVEYAQPTTEAGINAREVAAIRRADKIADPKLREAAINRIQFLAANDRKLIQEQERAAAAGKAEFTDRYNNVVAKLGAGVDVPYSERPTEQQLKAMYGEYEGGIKFAEMNTYARMAPDIATLATATTQDAARVLAKYVPDPKADNFAFQQKIFQGMKDSFTAVQQQRNADPAGFLLRNSAVVGQKYGQVLEARDAYLAAQTPEARQAAFAAMQEKGQAFSDFMVSEQARLGVPVAKRALLPAAVVTQVMEDFDSKVAEGDVTGAVNSIRATVQAFGDGAGRAIPQLGKNAGPVARMALENLDERTIKSYVAAAAQGDDVLKKSMGNDAWNKMQETVRAQLAPLDATGTSEYPAYFDMTMKVAALKVKGGMDPAQAAQQAASETINGRYVFAGQNGTVSYRVPLRDVQGSPIDAQAVIRSADRTISTLRPEDIMSTMPAQPGVSMEQIKGYQVRRIQQTARWLTTGDESGLELAFVDDDGRLTAVRGANGQPFRKTWSELAQSAQATRQIDEQTAAYRATIRGTR